MRLHLGPHGADVERRAEALRAGDAAGRIARRDATFWGGDGARQRSVAGRLGWLDAPRTMQAAVPELESFALEVRDAGFADAVVLGMGGSSLAPEVLRQSIPRRAGFPTLHVLDTTDPAAILAVAGATDPARTLFFVSSKSGTTIEALSLFAYFHAIVEAARPGRAGENLVAITDAGTPLQELARTHRFRRVFTNASDVGGRYSALTYFGLAPGAVAGMDVAALLARGTAAASETDDALLLGVALAALAEAGRDKVTFLVAPEVAAFGLWVEQLIAESTGKLGLGIVPVTGEPPGTPARYDDDRLFIQIRLESGSNGDLDSVVGAFRAEGQPVIVLELGDPYDLGREFFRWEYAVAVAGQVLGVNPFDEPNVQESKDNTAQVLAAFARDRRLDATAVDAATAPVTVTPDGATSDDLAAAVASLLARAERHNYVAITAYIRQTDHAEAAFAPMRADLRDAMRVATTLGYGPRFLHSTGQLHKGGPPAGVFLQITAPDECDVAIPGSPYTFGQLKQAQAIGDLQSLAAHGRPALRVHLGGGVDGGLDALATAIRRAISASQVRR